MSYEKQNFNDGAVLFAQQLNAMDEQIATNEQKIAELASGSLQVVFTSTGITDDETGFWLFGANKSVSECIAAFENGIPVYGALDPSGDSFTGTMVTCEDSIVAFEVASVINVAKRYMIMGLNEGENDMWLGTYSDGATMADIPTDDHINSLIDTKLGAIENGSY
jgi:hypothetical protein